MRTNGITTVTRSTSEAFSAKTSRGRFIKRLGGLTAIGLGIAGLEAAVASAETWHCCWNNGSSCDAFCQSNFGNTGYDCNGPTCGYYCNCHSNVGSCFDTNTGPC